LTTHTINPVFGKFGKSNVFGKKNPILVILVFFFSREIYIVKYLRFHSGIKKMHKGRRQKGGKCEKGKEN
jgi:hypothetical protein